jgi:hypothetical protein
MMTLFSDADFAQLGAGAFAYLKVWAADDVTRPQAYELSPGLPVFVLHDANGSPMAIYGDPGTALAEAEEHGVEVVLVS